MLSEILAKAHGIASEALDKGQTEDGELYMDMLAIEGLLAQAEDVALRMQRTCAEIRSLIDAMNRTQEQIQATEE